jgi:hypothetical protein
VRYQPLREEELPKHFVRPYTPVCQNGHYLYVDIAARLIIDGIPTESLLIKEEEVAGEIFGDFIQQFEGSEGHNPYPLPARYNQFVDRVAFILDLRKPHDNGQARWAIPMSIVSTSSEQQIRVVQEYTLADRRLTVLKGTSVLLECQLPT